MSGFDDVLELFTSKWKIYILGMLVERPKRFGELTREVIGISKKVLTENLRELESEGLISRKVWWENSLMSAEYSLTGSGEDFCVILDSMIKWGSTYLSANPDKTAAL
jgi:DNA-binding HxlR family transcriptional regulator